MIQPSNSKQTGDSDRSAMSETMAEAMAEAMAEQGSAQQMPLFGGDPAPPVPVPPVVKKIATAGHPLNPHLLAARRLARKMRQLPDHSAEETRAGLAICRQLKAYLRDDRDAAHPRKPRH